MFKNITNLKKFYYFHLLQLNTLFGFILLDKYGFKTTGCYGPSMLPTIDRKDNIVLIDCFTHRFLRNPKKGEIICCENPTDKESTLVKRIINTENEYAKFYC